MSLNDIANPTRRGFLRSALSAAAVPVLPKGSFGALEDLTTALPDLSGYALESVPRKMAAFLSSYIDGFAFLNDDRAVHEKEGDLLSHSSAHIFPKPQHLAIRFDPNQHSYIPNIIGYVPSFDSRVRIPKEISEGIPFKIGHLICEQNAYHYWAADYAFLDPETDRYTLEHSLEDGLEQCSYHLRDLKSILLMRPDLGSIEDVAEMSVSEFYENVSKPLIKENLREVIRLKTLYKRPEDLGEEIFRFNQSLLEDLKTQFPEYSDVFDDSIKQFCMQQEVNLARMKNPSACTSHPPGHFRMEKQGLGVYKLHTPEIR